MEKFLAMDDAAANWHSYHFNDTLLLHTTYWMLWRGKLQGALNDNQLQGTACIFCTAPIPDIAQGIIEYMAGYTVAFCPHPCHIQFE